MFLHLESSEIARYKLERRKVGKLLGRTCHFRIKLNVQVWLEWFINIAALHYSHKCNLFPKYSRIPLSRFIFRSDVLLEEIMFLERTRHFTLQVISFFLEYGRL